MTREQQFRKLMALSTLKLDASLATLQQAAKAREQSLNRLADLDRPNTVEGLGLVAAEEVALRYQRWADLRRMEINQTLARQTAEWLTSRDAATQAFGKAEALKSLRDKLR